MSYKEDILRLRAEGKSYGEISHELGCSKGTVAYYLKETTEDLAVTVADPQHTKKIITYMDNYKMKRPCNGCGQFLHSSQMDLFDPQLEQQIIKSVVDVDTYEAAKRQVVQAKFLCANCNRLRKFREETKGK